PGGRRLPRSLWWAAMERRECCVNLVTGRDTRVTRRHGACVTVTARIGSHHLRDGEDVPSHGAKHLGPGGFCRQAGGSIERVDAKPVGVGSPRTRAGPAVAHAAAAVPPLPRSVAYLLDSSHPLPT